MTLITWQTGYWWPEFEKVRFKYESYGEFMDDYPKMIEMVRRKSEFIFKNN